MRSRSLGLMALIVVILAALFAVPHVRGASEAIAPQVVDTDPQSGQEMALTGAVTFYFNVPMDHSSVEAAFTVVPKVDGTFDWTNDLTATFKPSAAWQRSTEYTFKIGSGAKSQAGAPIKDTFTLKLKTAGALEVTQILPENGTEDVQATATVTVIFNRPVVPLLPVEEMAKLPTPITITPAVDGQGTWLNTSIYTFKPTKGFAGGTTYVVTVKKGLTDITGAVLENDANSAFTTSAPRVIDFVPNENSSQVMRDPVLSVTFSQPMDTASVEKATSLSKAGGSAVDATVKWDDAHQILTITPKGLLDYGADYRLNIDKGTAHSETGGTLKDNTTIDFTTIPLPTLVNVDTYYGVEFDFSGPMAFKDFKSHVTIDPKPTLYYDDYTSDEATSYRIGFSQEPSTHYTITADFNGVLDKYGTQVQVNAHSDLYELIGPNKIRFSFDTPAYPAEASLQTGSSVGMYSAYRTTTRVYSTHRNIDTIDLALAPLSIPDLMNLSASNYWDAWQNFSPKNYLRQWSLSVENPQNVLRYDLLTISATGPTASVPPQADKVCAGAPVTRLKLGASVVVLADDPTPLRVRDVPGTKGKVLTQVNPGTAFKVGAGPVCGDGFLWWQVTSTDGKVQGWVAEGDMKHYFVGPAELAQTSTAPTALKPGAYWLEMSSPDLERSDPLKHVMIVATTNITLKVSAKQAFVWATDLQSGQPVSGLTVQFFADSSTLLGKADTDSSGIARFDLPSRLDSLYTGNLYALIDDGKNFGFDVADWGDGIAPWDYNLPGDYYPQDLTVYMYTDRALYRPGQPVHFRGVMRSRDDMTYTVSGLKTVPVEIFNDQGQSVYKKDLAVNAFGTFSDTFTLDDNAALGYYRIVASPDQPVTSDNNRPQYSFSFSVAEYRLPEFQVKVNSDQTEVTQGDKIKVTVDSTFFFGGAVSNAHVDWSVTSNPYYFNYKGPGYYNFTDYNEDAGYDDTGNNYQNATSQGSGTTDAQGKFSIELPADLGKSKQSQVFNVEADVTDESNQVVAGTMQITVHQGQFYIGLAPDEYVGTAKKASKINLITVNWDSKPQPNTDLSIHVVERKWSSVQTVEPSTGRTNWTYDVKENPITDGVAHTSDDGKATFEFTPDHGGIYKVYATSRDSRGNQVTSSTFVWVAGPDYVPWRQQNTNRIDLKVDRTDYKIGDTAQVLIASPFQGDTKALVTVERGHILKTEVIDMPNNSYVYKLPITPDMAPNAFISVMVVKGVDEHNPVAAFRMGLAQIGVETDRLNLKITVTPDKAQAGPRETVNYKIHVADYKGDPVQSEVGVALVDLASLSILPDQSTPILQHFYGQQGLAVRTSSTLTVSVDQQTQQIINTIKGGGGGGPEGGIFEVRQQFIDTPLWAPTVTTDANGDAVVTVKMPDNLTTFRLDARAVTQPTGELSTTLVGQTTFDLLSTKPVLIRPVTPRFYVVGDNSTLAAIVNNNTDQDQDVKVSIQAKGVDLQAPADQTAKIPARGRARFDWPVVVQDVNAVDVTFFASTTDNKYTDAAKSAVGQGDDKTLPVLRYEAPETVGTGGTIGSDGGDRTEGIVLPRRFNVTQGTLDIRVEPSLAAGATDALNVLKNYPYQCIEQTVSRFLPNLMTYRALKQLKLDKPEMRDQLMQAMNYAVQRLYNEQHADGGWGWFIEEPSDPIVTAYAIIGLSEARNQGFDINKDVIARAVQFVASNRKSLTDQPSTWQLNRQAFLEYALARAGAGNFSNTVRLFDIRDKMSLYARAYLLMTFHILDPKEAKYSPALISDLQNSAVASATGMHWEESFVDYWNWNTNTRTTAIVLEALTETQPTNQLIPNVVRWLMVARKSDAWETTQETAWAVMALTSWMQYTGELQPNYTFGVTVNDKALTSDQKASPDTVQTTTRLQVAVKDLLADQVNTLTLNRTTGDGILYYTAHLTAYLPADQVKALDRGISLTRTYSLVDDPDHKPITQAHVGDNIRVTLTIVAPSSLNYVVITDPIPAGAEGVNPDLATTGTIGTEPPGLSQTDPLYWGWGWWWFSKIEMRDDKTVLYASYLPAGTYQYTYTLRAGLAGQYHVIPTTGQEFYFPEVYGRSDGMLFTLLPAEAGKDPTNPTPTATQSK